MTLTHAIAQRLLQLCQERHLTLNKLSIICGMTQSTLNNIVNTGSKNPTVSTIKKVCDGLDMSLSQFFDSPLFDELEQEIQ